jgi:site-specific recombinase XerD
LASVATAYYWKGATGSDPIRDCCREPTRYNAACKFSEFCAERGVHDLAQVKPVHVAGYIESLRAGFAKPTIKQHLAAIHMLFDWLVVGQIIDVNPAHAVRGPKHVVSKGRTPVLNREEARALLSDRHEHAHGPA